MTNPFNERLTIKLKWYDMQWYMVWHGIAKQNLILDPLIY